MRFSRSLLLAALPIAFLVASCSQPADTQAPDLAPQFGTPGYDQANAVVNDPQRGHVYVAGISAANLDRERGTVYLRRYSLNGTLAWKRLIQVATVIDDPNVHVAGRVEGMRVDASGNVYVGWSRQVYDWYNREAFLLKFNSSGRLLSERSVGIHLADFEVDGVGNLYLAVGNFGDHPYGAHERYYLRKYDAKGRLVWERSRTYDSEGQLENPAQAIPAPYDIGLASDGSLYVAGSNANTCCTQEGGAELSKYSNAGVTLWEKPGAGVVAVAGRNFYLLSGANLRKFDPNGVLRWQKTLTGFVAHTGSLAVDASLNLYVAGEASSRDSSYDLFVRKYTPAGAVSWTYAPRLTTQEAALGVSAKGSGDVYLAGFTYGKVNGVNSGASDSFLLRLNSQGQKVWSR